LRAGLWLGAVGGMLALVGVVGHLGLAVVMIALLTLMAGNGLVMPTATALALEQQGESAGSASALIGLGRFGFAAGVAPLVGLAGAHSGVPMGVLLATLSIAALCVNLALGGPVARSA
jgi:DHA1 family bicyclomycin/chloramphenicol resistance-like MFS transporter